MKFAFSSVLILASFSAVLSQSTSSAAAPSSSSSSSSTSSSSSSAAAAGGSGGSASSAASAPAATCSIFSGNPTAQPFGCVPGATTVTPPYDSASLASFQIGAYKPAKSGEPISSVATDMAKTVTSLYPTLTVSFSDIVAEYVSELSASATMYQQNHADGAIGSYQMPAALPMIAMAVAAVAAGGAFIL